MSKVKKRKNNIISKKEHIIIITFVLLIIAAMLFIQKSTDGLTKQFGLSLIPSVIVDMVGILITYYIIAYLLSKNEEKKAKEKAYKITGVRYLGLIKTIGTNYVHLITRKPYGSKEVNPNEELKEQITEILDRIEELVPDNFMEYNIELNSIVQQQITKGYKIEKQYLEYQLFCRKFKKEYEEVFEKFIIRYIGFLPDDLRESLLNIETLLGRVLATPLDFGLNLSMTVVYEEYIGYLKEIGKELIILLNYFKAFEG